HHVDANGDAEELSRERQGRAPLSGAGLGGKPPDAGLRVVERLRDGGVRLVRSRRADTFVLVINVCRGAERRLETMRAIERRWTPEVVDVAHRFGDRDPALARDLLLDQRSGKYRRQRVGTDR